MKEVEIPGGLPGRLFKMGMPGRFTELQSDLEQMRAEGVELIVNLTPQDEIQAKSEAYFEAIVDQRLGIEHVELPIEDQGVPLDRAAYETIVDRVETMLRDVRASSSTARRASDALESSSSACFRTWATLPETRQSWPAQRAPGRRTTSSARFSLRGRANSLQSGRAPHLAKELNGVIATHP